MTLFIKQYIERILKLKYDLQRTPLPQQLRRVRSIILMTHKTITIV